MSLQGSLQDISAANLIQQYCQDRKTARLDIVFDGQQATLFFKNGAVTHASLGDLQGEEVVYLILSWTEGQFHLEPSIEVPQTTIQRSWSGLLLEGARRLDEAGHRTETEIENLSEENHMELDNVLKEMGDQVSGFVAAVVVGMDGINLAQISRSKKADPENIGAQMTLFAKMQENTIAKHKLGEIEDILLSTEDTYLLIRFLKDHNFYLGMVADRKTAQLGNMRLVSKLYLDRVAKVMPH
jgi:predicted regulator of Ras-like GTPase activity (Roadblock/LC7/MglB family)